MPNRNLCPKGIAAIKNSKRAFTATVDSKFRNEDQKRGLSVSATTSAARGCAGQRFSRLFYPAYFRYAAYTCATRSYAARRGAVENSSISRWSFADDDGENFSSRQSAGSSSIGAEAFSQQPISQRERGEI